MTTLDFSIRILSAILFGFMIGVERQLTGHPAGIQTNILVCLGSCIFVLVSQILSASDMTRIASQVVTGVGFLGSGIIFKDGVNVRGINTAATIWCAAAIGVLTSTGVILYAFIATVAIVLINIAFKQTAGITTTFSKSAGTETYYKITVTCAESQSGYIRSMILNQISGSRLTLTDLKSSDAIGDKVEIVARLICRGRRRDDFVEKAVALISKEQSVSSIEWELI